MRCRRELYFVMMALAWGLGALPAHVGASPAEPTAFELIKEGNRYVGEQSKDKVVEIRGDKSIGSVTPTLWSIVYLDPNARFKEVEVKFGAGKMLDVKRPIRMLEPVKGGREPFDLAKLTVDSDKAIQIVLREPLLEKLTIQATAAKLQRGDAGLPVWKVRIWAAKLRSPSEQANLGEVMLSAEDGKVIKNDLHINRVD